MALTPRCRTNSCSGGNIAVNGDNGNLGAYAARTMSYMCW
jgi:hypothetical protein